MERVGCGLRAAATCRELCDPCFRYGIVVASLAMQLSTKRNNRYAAGRRLLFASSVLFALFAAVPAESQNVPLWGLAQHERDLQEAQTQIADATERGFLPVGLSVQEKGIYVLYSLNIGTPVREILLYHFDDPQTMEGEMNTLVERGLVPMDISHTDDGVYALLISDGFGIDNWVIVNMPFNTANIEQVQDALTQGNMSPWGLSVNDDTAYVLGVSETRSEAAKEAILLTHRFHVDSYFPAINDAVQQRRLYPWGLAIADDQLLVQYVQASEEQE